MENLSDIVAEMRRGTKLPGYWRSCDLNEILKYHADRIEAAWKREKAEIEADALAVGGVVEAARHTPGNAAAMREALVFLRDKELYLLEGNVRHCVGLTVFGLEQTCKIMRGMIEEALSTPPRNCDLPLVVDGSADTNANRAWHVFNYRNPGAYFDVPGLLRCIDWLLAPAAERKGDGDGSK